MKCSKCGNELIKMTQLTIYGEEKFDYCEKCKLKYNIESIEVDQCPVCEEQNNITCIINEEDLKAYQCNLCGHQWILRGKANGIKRH